MPSSIDTVIPERQTPLPPSPIEDYDLGHARTWDSDDEYTPTTETSPSRKGKAKQYDPQHTDAAGPEVIGMTEMDGNGVYPPVNDDAAETRRIEEVSSVSSQATPLLTTRYRLFGAGNLLNDNAVKQPENPHMQNLLNLLRL